MMDWKMFFTVFGTVFVAELGDKTQLATMLFSTDKDFNKINIFLGASFALILTSAIGVFAGKFLSDYISNKDLSVAAGICFIVIGVWAILKA